MTTTVPRPARRSITLNRVARIGLVSVLALTVAACATRQQRDSMAQLNAGRMVQTVLDRVSEDPAPGIKQTVDVKKSMYSEVIGGLQGARTTSAVAGESWAARYEACLLYTSAQNVVDALESHQRTRVSTWSVCIPRHSTHHPRKLFL